MAKIQILVNDHFVRHDGIVSASGVSEGPPQVIIQYFYVNLFTNLLINTGFLYEIFSTSNVFLTETEI